MFYIAWYKPNLKEEEAAAVSQEEEHNHLSCKLELLFLCHIHLLSHSLTKSILSRYLTASFISFWGHIYIHASLNLECISIQRQDVLPPSLISCIFSLPTIPHLKCLQNTITFPWLHFSLIICITISCFPA